MLRDYYSIFDLYVQICDCMSLYVVLFRAKERGFFILENIDSIEKVDSLILLTSLRLRELSVIKEKLEQKLAQANEGGSDYVGKRSMC